MSQAGIAHEVGIFPASLRKTCLSISGSKTPCASEKLPRLTGLFRDHELLLTLHPSISPVMKAWKEIDSKNHSPVIR